MESYKNSKKRTTRELRILARDFLLLNRPEVKQLIENETNYFEGQRKLLDIYTKVYLS